MILKISLSLSLIELLHPNQWKDPLLRSEHAKIKRLFVRAKRKHISQHSSVSFNQVKAGKKSSAALIFSAKKD
jgi:hypothetical protein